MDLESDIETRMAALVARDQDQLRCPFPLFDDIRRDEPVYFSPSLGAWVITRYEDCLQILHDPVAWSTQMHTGPRPLNVIMGDRMAELASDPATAGLVADSTAVIARGPVLASADPPIHVRQRKLVNGAFRPSRLRTLESLVREVADRLIDGFETRGTVQFVEEFAVGLPMTIIAYALGVEDDDLATFKRWSDDMVMPVGNQSPSLSQVRGYLESHRDFAAYFTAKIAERQATPVDDVVSDVANAEVDGDRLVLREQLSIISQLLTAGNETTTKLITAMAQHLAERPELQDQLRQDRSIVPVFVEEVLRLEAPVGGLFRRATTDITVGATTIPEGDHVWVLYASANRDEDRFQCPADLDLDRPDLKDHIAFGHGQHYCLGAGLARLEATVGLNAILDRLGTIELAEHNTFRYEDSYLLRGLCELHLTFTPIDP
jgi:cytochrome P450